jgi:hypothetical protein
MVEEKGSLGGLMTGRGRRKGERTNEYLYFSPLFEARGRIVAVKTACAPAKLLLTIICIPVFQLYIIIY